MKSRANSEGGKKMADFVSGQDLDDLFFAIDEDLFWEDQAYQNDVSTCVAEINFVGDFRCIQCDKSRCKRLVPWLANHIVA